MIPGDVANFPIPEEYRYKRLLLVWLLVEPDHIKIITRWNAFTCWFCSVYQKENI